MRFKTLLVASAAAFAFTLPAAAQYYDGHDHGAQPAAAAQPPAANAPAPTPPPPPARPTPVPTPPAPAQLSAEELAFRTELGFTPAAFRSHVMFLADDRLEGREAGTRGYDMAANYVASQFAGLGVRPGNGDSWYQQVTLGRSTPEAGGVLRVGDRAFTFGQDFLFFPSFQSQPVAVTAPLVFAGYGIDAPTQGHDDYRGIDARGKIVVVLEGQPEGLRSDVAAHMGSARAQMAAARGAIGVIVIRSAESATRNPIPRVAGFLATRPSTTWVNAQGNAGAPHQQLRFTAVGDDALATALFAGSRRTWAQVRADLAAGRRPAPLTLRPQVHVERNARAETFSSPNVLGIIPGSDPALANEYVVLMAHLDHVGIVPEAAGADANPNQTPGATDRIRNGAMDNATGIATLIEVARKFNDPANRPRRPILLAAVTAEEKGLLGAGYLANNPVIPAGARVVGVVNLDMPILLYDFQDVIAFGAEHSELGPMVGRASQAMGVALSQDPLPEEGLFTRSDHYPFVQAGVPSVFLMTGFRNGGEEKFRGFLATNYHSVRDELGQAFDWRAGARFAELNYRIAREVANAPAAPRWYRGSFFGDTLGGNQPRAPQPVAAAPAPAAGGQ